MTTTNLAIPTVHLNGTSKDALVTQLCDAIDAIHAAGTALAKACPNGRDYYVQAEDVQTPGSAISRAMTQHEARMNKLREVATELETIAHAIG